jgi:hypothetical protein
MVATGIPIDLRTIAGADRDFEFQVLGARFPVAAQ